MKRILYPMLVLLLLFSSAYAVIDTFEGETVTNANSIEGTTACDTIEGQVLTAGGAWHDDWGRKVVITLDRDGGASPDLCSTGTLTTYPVLLTEATVPAEMLDSDLAYNCQADGGDLRAYTGDYSASNPATENTNRIALEVVTVTLHASAYKLQVWVEVPTVNCADQGSDTIITLYYDATGKNQPAQDATYGQHAVWDGGSYEAVYHMDEASGTVYNSANNSHDLATIGGTPEYGFAGQIGKGINLTNADSEYFSNNSAPFTAAPNTMSAWVNLTSEATLYIMAIGDVSETDEKFNLYRDSADDNLQVVAYSTAGGMDAATTTTDSIDANDGFKLAQGVQTTTTSRQGYVDAANSSGENTASNTPSGLDTVAIGADRDASPGYYWQGVIDEARFVSAALSIHWLTADYNIQNAPETYVLEGSPGNP